MDKILLAVFLSSFAGFITAIVSVVKLVNEKENKTSEFRQAWTNSIRNCIADLAAKLSALTSAYVHQKRLLDIEAKLCLTDGIHTAKRLEVIRAEIENTNKTIASNTHDQYQTFALCKLHFKPDEKDFLPIEAQFKSIRDGYAEILKSKKTDEREKIKSHNYENIQAIIDSGRKILKNEWERVKEGEAVYKHTKAYSFGGGIVMLFVLIITGGIALYLVSTTSENKLNGSSNLSINAKASDTNNCWQLKNFDKRIFKLNSCTGETVELGINATKRFK